MINNLKHIEPLDRKQILTELPMASRHCLAGLEILERVDSTNHYALAQHLAPFACLAEYQTAGRGRQGRQWVSPYGSGLCLSLKQHYSTLNESLAGLNIALAVTVTRILHDLGITKVGLKWPNDILWQGKKLAGLLLEKRGNDVVIGIGLNVKMPAVETISQAWVDLYTIFEEHGLKKISRNTLASLLIAQCLDTLIRYPQIGLVSFLKDWHNFDLSYGQQVTLKFPQANSITGIACGIDEHGALLLQVGQHRQHYNYGEVSLRL